MIVIPKNLKLNRILTNRTINFDTTKRTLRNFVLISSPDYESFYETLKSKLFKVNQLMCVFTPRIVRVLNRKNIRFIQKDIYSDIFENTSGRIKFGKALVTSYGDRNLVYNVIPEMTETKNMLSDLGFEGYRLQKRWSSFLDELYKNKVEDVSYDNNYLIFPLTTFIEDFKKKVMVETHSDINPIITFLKGMRNKSLDLSIYGKFERIIFYVPKNGAMLVLDPKAEDFFDIYPEFFLRVNRLNNSVNNLDSLIDDVDNGSEEEQKVEDEFENKKEQIKDIIISKIAKSLKATNLTDYDSATKEEQDLIVAIDKKIDTYLNNPENLKRSFKDLTNEVETDNDIKMNAIRYVESKKSGAQKLNSLSKNISKEVEIVDSILDLQNETDKFIEPASIKVAEEYFDKRVENSTLASLDETYNKKQAKVDMINVLSSFSNQNYIPMTIDKLDVVDSSDDFNAKKTISVSYKTDENKRISFQLDVPEIVDGRNIYIGGNKFNIGKQLARLPIVKTKPDRVEITTSFNKMTIERSSGKVSRKNAYLQKILKNYESEPNIKIIYGSNELINNKFNNDYEYEELASFLTSIENDKYHLNFNRENMRDEINLLDLPEGYFDKDFTPFGLIKETNKVIYIENKNGEINTVEPGEEIKVEKIANNIFDFIIKDVLHENISILPTIGKSFVYSKVKFLTVTFPVFTIAGITNGITDVLKRHHVEYKLSEKKMNLGTDWVEVKFKNKYFYYKDKIENTMLLNILYAMDTDQYDFEDFDRSEPYMDYFIEKMHQVVYVKNMLRINLDKMVDPITLDVLKDLKLPTNIIDLLLLANNMLCSNDYIPQNDIRNFRIRGNEQIYVIMYKLIANAYMKYQRAKLNGKNDAIDLPKNILISTLMKQHNINTASVLNPLLELETMSSCTPKGISGINLGDAYTLELRTYHDSMEGYLSGNSTPFSGSAGTARSISYDPKIDHIRGYIRDVDKKELNALNMLSPAELVSPFTATHSDPPRIAMMVSQSKHTVPVKVAHKQLLSSGTNKTMAFMLSNDFCFKAEKDGFIEEIDSENKIVILKYDDGTRDAIDMKNSLVKNSNSGFYLNQEFYLAYKKNERFKAGDVIAYNSAFFTGKGKDVDYLGGTLAKVAIASNDLCFEDATLMSETLSEKCSTKVTMMKSVALGPNAIIHNIANVGDEIEVNDHLLDFTTSFNDENTAEFLQDLANKLGDEGLEVGNEFVKSKYHGQVVDIKIYYNVPFETLSPTLKKLIKKYEGKVVQRKEALLSRNIKTNKIRLDPTDQQVTDKIAGDYYEGVLIQFYVEYYAPLAEGDKISYSVA